MCPSPSTINPVPSPRGTCCPLGAPGVLGVFGGTPGTRGVRPWVRVTEVCTLTTAGLTCL